MDSHYVQKPGKGQTEEDYNVTKHGIDPTTSVPDHNGCQTVTEAYSMADSSQQSDFCTHYNNIVQSEIGKDGQYQPFHYSQNLGAYYPQYSMNKFQVSTTVDQFSNGSSGPVDMTSCPISTAASRYATRENITFSSEVSLTVKDTEKLSTANLMNIGDYNQIDGVEQQCTFMKSKEHETTGSVLNGAISDVLKNPVVNIPVVASCSSSVTKDGRTESLRTGIGVPSSSSSADEHSRCTEQLQTDCLYTCAACLSKFPTVCSLHSHMKEAHCETGSYLLCCSTLTAYPKFKTCTKDTQTEDERGKRNHPKLRTKRNRKKVFDDSSENIETRKTRCKSNDCKVKEKLNNSKLDIAVHNSKTGDVSKTVQLKCLSESAYTRKGALRSETAEAGADDDNSEVVPLVQNSESSGTDEYEPVPDIEIRKKRKKKKIKSSYALKCQKKDSSENDDSQMKMKMEKSKKVAEKRTSGIEKEDNSTVTEMKTTSEVACAVKMETKTEVTKRNKLNGSSKKGVCEKIECRICDIPFTKRINLRIHIRTQHSDLPNICTLCSENCESEQGLMDHRKTVHHRRNHQCELCGKVLSTKGMLEGHYLVHKGIKPFACSICVPKREFTRKCQLKAHMETHSEEKNLQCEFCGKPFNARYLMINHVKHCSGNKPYKCQYCEMGFVSNHCLQRHLRTHTGEKPFVCEVCAFASGNASCLARHMRVHTGEKPFICKYCQQAFAAPGALKKHVRVHTQEKPYKCSYCTKAFTQRWNLKTHERQHTGETPYKCHVCGMGYKQNVLLKTHLKSHYGCNDPPPEQMSNQSTSQHVNQSCSTSQSGNVTQSTLPAHTGVVVADGKLSLTGSQIINQSQIPEFQHQSVITNQVLMSGIPHIYTQMS